MSTSDSEHTTGSRPFIKNFNAKEAKALMARSAPREFKAGDVLLVQGEEGSSMLVLEQGVVRVMRGDHNLAVLERGASIGEMALLDPAPRSASVVADANGEASELSRESFMRMLEEGDPVAIKALGILTATVCNRLNAVNEMVQKEVSGPSSDSEENVFGRLWKRVLGGGRK